VESNLEEEVFITRGSGCVVREKEKSETISGGEVKKGKLNGGRAIRLD